MIPAVSASAYHAARTASAYISRSDRGRLLVSGSDRASYLHGLFTNDITGLRPGEGCYTAYLTPQGRMIADLYVHELGDSILLTMEEGVKDGVLAKLERFVFTEDVAISDLTGTLAQIAIVGPHASDTTSRAFPGVKVNVLEALPLHGTIRAEPGAIVAHIDLGVEGFEVSVDRAGAKGIESALAASGAFELDAETAEAIRIEAGIPRFHRDMDEETIPLEAGLEARAISFTKGCYVGQEVIVRVLHRGHGRVAKKLVGLILERPNVPAIGALVTGTGREVGRVTSSTMSPALGRPIALATVHRDFAEPATALDVAGEPASVAALPFVPPARR